MSKQQRKAEGSGPVDSEKVRSRAATPSNSNGSVVSFAHEINNPLAALLNLLHLVESEATLTQRGRRYLKLAEGEIQRISQLTHSALEHSKDTVVLKDIDIPELVRSVLDLYASRFDSRGIEIYGRYCGNGNLAGDAGLLRRMLSNLLLNAADATPNGGKIYTRVSATHEWTGQKRHGLRVTVADNGCGIPGDCLPRVLEPFFTTKGKSGTGIGLSLVRDTVQKHRGVLRVRSCTTRGRSGTVFSVFLPFT
jgi:signal transduction histidine kinase